MCDGTAYLKMPTPINNQHSQAVLFSSAYLGSVRYYAALLRAGANAIIDTGERIGRHSWMHNHCRIMGANGLQLLTVPVEHVDSAGGLLVRDLRISAHGDWRRVHWGAIFSAYGKAPFFEYAEDDLRAVYDHDYKWLVDFNVALHGMVVDFLDLPITVAVADCTAMSSSCAIDLRGRIGGKKHDADDGIVDVPYYSVWDERHGFVPSLSIIDLLMNCGREAVFVLHKMLNGILI